MIGNCLLCALVAWASKPRATRIHAMRNRRRRWHFYWTRDGKRYEFHAPGRSAKSYLRNAIYRGQVRKF